MILLLTGVMAFIAACLLAWGIVLFLRRNPLEEQAEAMQNDDQRRAGPSLWCRLWCTDIYGIEEKSAAEVAVVSAAVAGGLAIMFLRPHLALLVCAAAFVAAPRFYGQLIQSRLRMAFAEDLGAAVRALGRGLRGGTELKRAFEYAAKEVGGIVGSEFMRVVEDSKGGKIENAVEKMAGRVNITEAWMLADAVRQLSRAGGGRNSLDLLDACADEIAARRARVRRVGAQTTQVRVEGAVASIVPVAMFLWFFFGYGEDYRVMVETTQGRTLLAVAVLTLVACWVITFAILRRVGMSE